jgi:hypothetical protein
VDADSLRAVLHRRNERAIMRVTGLGLVNQLLAVGRAEVRLREGRALFDSLLMVTALAMRGRDNAHGLTKVTGQRLAKAIYSESRDAAHDVAAVAAVVAAQQVVLDSRAGTAEDGAEEEEEEEEEEDGRRSAASPGPIERQGDDGKQRKKGQAEVKTHYIRRHTAHVGPRAQASRGFGLKALLCCMTGRGRARLLLDVTQPIPEPIKRQPAQARRLAPLTTQQGHVYQNLPGLATEQGDMELAAPISTYGKRIRKQAKNAGGRGRSRAN